ncbi:MAG: ADP-ribosylglycohydrolase family protein [Gammaproteobacteria bacterium]|nr:ADP-ribosylglycohydrolase family protein [Gammaproteobacteria bacterium]
MAITELGVHQLEGDAESLTRSLSVPKPSCLNKRQQKRTIRSRFLGCLLGGAVGDALGAPVEFMSRDEIVDRFGSNGIRDYALAYGKLGAITDDTQMTLFTAEGLLRSRVRQILKGLSSPVAQTAYAYQRWLITQGMSSSLSNTARMDDGWLFTINELHSQRAPGYTCLSALQNMSAPERAAQNNSKGCGGVMRVAPAGLFAWQFRKEVSLTDVFELGRDLAALTHGHPTGSLTAGVFTVLVMLLTDGQQLTQALAIAKTCLRNYRDYEETLTAIELAQQLAVEAIPAEQAIQKLGEGWIAEEALAISIYCALMAKTFRQGILMAVNHDGDSDSTGAITGHLLGAMLGTKKIPRHWLENLELYDVIEQVAIDLFEFPNWPLSTYGGDQAFEQMIWKKYPGC